MTHQEGHMYRSRHVEIAGPLPRGLLEELGRRFGPVAVTVDGERTVVRLDAVDEAALRAFLEALWESGIAVLHLRTTGPTDDDRGEPS